jgi:hypothetical protein
MAKKQSKPERVVANAYKYFDSIDDNYLEDPSYIPESIQPYINSALREDRAFFDLIEKRLNLVDRDSDDYAKALRQREMIVKKFVTIRNQIDLLNKRTKGVKGAIATLNPATSEENTYVNLGVHGNQWDSFHIDEDGKFHFGLDIDNKLNFFKLDEIQDSYPMITEPFKEKIDLFKLANTTKDKRDNGETFDWEWTYDKLLYNISQAGPQVAMGLAFTDVAGDGRSKSFAEQWDEGLADESLYRDDNGDLIVNEEGAPFTSNDMRNPANARVTGEVFSKYMTNVMAEIGGWGMPQEGATVSGLKDDEANWTDVMGSTRMGVGTSTGTGETPKMIGNMFSDLSGELPDPKPREIKSEESIANQELEDKTNNYLRKMTTGTQPISDKFKAMPKKLYDYYVKRVNELAKMARTGDPKANSWINSLPGGDYYSFLTQLEDWRKSEVSPAELLKKYSK